jgi:rRNA maturation protein Nop10
MRRRNDIYQPNIENLKVCTNPECPKPTRTYTHIQKCPFCGSPLRQVEPGEVEK